jgi:hypothetical protein
MSPTRPATEPAPRRPGRWRRAPRPAPSHGPSHPPSCATIGRPIVPDAARVLHPGQRLAQKGDHTLSTITGHAAEALPVQARAKRRCQGATRSSPRVTGGGHSSPVTLRASSNTTRWLLPRSRAHGPSVPNSSLCARPCTCPGTLAWATCPATSNQRCTVPTDQPTPATIAEMLCHAL